VLQTQQQLHIQKQQLRRLGRMQQQQHRSHDSLALLPLLLHIC
jgi:hypothetical protein